MHPDDAWRWMVKGLGGIVTMVVGHHDDPHANGCPKQWLDDLEKQADRIARVVREQRERQGPSDG